MCLGGGGRWSEGLRSLHPQGDLGEAPHPDPGLAVVAIWKSEPVDETFSVSLCLFLWVTPPFKSNQNKAKINSKTYKISLLRIK